MSSEISITNTGELEVNNRKRRRTFSKSDPSYTKSTWSRQSKKKLKRKRKLGRK
jgi:hypothetical protein